MSLDDPKLASLPVAGYKAQSQSSVDLVNANKQIEEQVLRVLDQLAALTEPLDGDSIVARKVVDQRWLAIGRTAIEQGFMAVNRSIFKPGRASLPEDKAAG